VLATIAINKPGLAKIKRLAGITHDHEFASRIHVDAGTVSRVLNGKSAPGPRFIGGCVEAFGADCFTDLFIVVPDDEGTAA
jgi:transcriptional regulator with XRE-family HTH domain